MSNRTSGNKDKAYAVAILDDMFFASKIREAAKAAGADVMFIKEEAAVHDFNPPVTPSLVIIDLANKNIDPLHLIGIIKSSDSLRDARVIGYLPHVEKELAARALDAGYDQVLPRSRLSNGLADIFAGIAKPES